MSGRKLELRELRREFVDNKIRHKRMRAFSPRGLLAQLLIFTRRVF